MKRPFWQRDLSPAVAISVIVMLVVVLIAYGWWSTRPKNPPPPGIQKPPPEVLEAIQRSKQMWEQRNTR